LPFLGDPPRFPMSLHCRQELPSADLLRRSRHGRRPSHCSPPARTVPARRGPTVAATRAHRALPPRAAASRDLACHQAGSRSRRASDRDPCRARAARLPRRPRFPGRLLLRAAHGAHPAAPFGRSNLLRANCAGQGCDRCASCTTRRMAESAAHLVEHVFPRAPVRQWVVTFPKRLGHFLYGGIQRAPSPASHSIRPRPEQPHDCSRSAAELKTRDRSCPDPLHSGVRRATTPWPRPLPDRDARSPSDAVHGRSHSGTAKPEIAFEFPILRGPAGRSAPDLAAGFTRPRTRLVRRSLVPRRTAGR